MMISSIACLETELNTLKIAQPDCLGNQVGCPLALRNKYEVLNNEERCDMENGQGFTVATKRKRRSMRMKQIPNLITSPNTTKNNHFCTLEPEKPVLTPFNNVTVIGDSHVRNLAELIRQIVTDATTVSGVCKPGAGVMSMKPTMEPPSGHCFVLMAGTNDVDAGRETILYEHLKEVLLACNKSSRVLMVPLTTRYDHHPNSNVHLAVNRVNAYMTDLCKQLDNVDMVDISSIGRQHYTSHGLHLRSSGKRLLARLVVTRLTDVQPIHSHGLQTLETNHHHISYATAVSKSNSILTCSENVNNVYNSHCADHFLRDVGNITQVN